MACFLFSCFVFSFFFVQTLWGWPAQASPCQPMGLHRPVRPASELRSSLRAQIQPWSSDRVVELRYTLGAQIQPGSWDPRWEPRSNAYQARELRSMLGAEIQHIYYVLCIMYYVLCTMYYVFYIMYTILWDHVLCTVSYWHIYKYIVYWAAY